MSLTNPSFNAEVSIRPAAGVYPGSTGSSGDASTGVTSISTTRGKMCGGESPFAYSATCRVNCYALHLCNWAEARVDCPRQYDENGNYLGRACCTEREYDQTHDQACTLAWRTVNGNGYCNYNCKEV